jgi:hypothetical protein
MGVHRVIATKSYKLYFKPVPLNNSALTALEYAETQNLTPVLHCGFENNQRVPFAASLLLKDGAVFPTGCVLQLTTVPALTVR